MKKSLTLNRIILILFAALIIIPSCKKKKGDDEAQSGQPGISFKANGEQKTFSITWFNTFQEGSNYVLFISGAMEGNNNASVSLRITSTQPITEMNYVNDTGAGRSIEFTDTDGMIYTSQSGPVNMIDVDKKTDSRVEGTFSGTTYHDGGAVNITEGKFICERAM